MGRKLLKVLVKLRTLVVMGLLVAALSMLNFFLGCEKEDPKPLYGVPPDSLPDGQSDEEMRVYYGPVPMDVVEDAGPIEDLPSGPDQALYGMLDTVDTTPPKDAQPEMVPLYGVQPIDVQPELPADVEEDNADKPLYGIQPVDVVEDAPEDVVDENVMVPLYGVQPMDIVEDTPKDAEQEVSAWYGPAPLYGVPGCN